MVKLHSFHMLPQQYTHTFTLIRHINHSFTRLGHMVCTWPPENLRKHCEWPEPMAFFGWAGWFQAAFLDGRCTIKMVRELQHSSHQISKFLWLNCCEKNGVERTGVVCNTRNLGGGLLVRVHVSPNLTFLYQLWCHVKKIIILKLSLNCKQNHVHSCCRNMQLQYSCQLTSRPAVYKKSICYCWVKT